MPNFSSLAGLEQCSARPLILFKTKTKTCLDFNFLSRPIPRQVLKWIFFETNTKTSLDIGNNSRPIPRVLIIDIFETNTAKFNPIDIEDHKGEHKNFYGDTTKISVAQMSILPF